MSTEQKLVAVVDAANSLTATITNKIAVIDSKVAQAVAAVPNAVRQAMDVTFFVDGVLGDDASDGSSWLTPMKSIAGAFNKMTSGARVAIVLKSGPVYSLPHDVWCGNKTVSIQPDEYTYNDPSTYVEIRSSSILAEDDRVTAGGFALEYNSSLIMYGCKLATTKLPLALLGKGHDIWRTSFIKTNTSKGSVVLQHCVLEINNGSFMYQHSGGSIGVADLLMRNILVVKVPAISLPVATGFQYLMGTLANFPVPFSLYGIEMVRQGATTWAELISQDMSNALTNLKD